MPAQQVQSLLQARENEAKRQHEQAQLKAQRQAEEEAKKREEQNRQWEADAPRREAEAIRLKAEAEEREKQRQAQEAQARLETEERNNRHRAQEAQAETKRQQYLDTHKNLEDKINLVQNRFFLFSSSFFWSVGIVFGIRLITPVLSYLPYPLSWIGFWLQYIWFGERFWGTYGLIADTLVLGLLIYPIVKGRRLKRLKSQLKALNTF